MYSQRLYCEVAFTNFAVQKRDGQYYKQTKNIELFRPLPRAKSNPNKLGIVIEAVRTILAPPKRFRIVARLTALKFGR